MRFFKCYLFFTSVIFLFTACQDSIINQLPQNPSAWEFKAHGTPIFLFLDNNYNYSENDLNKTAVYIDNNNAADGVYVVSQISDNDYDDAVYIVNQNTGTVITMFFHKGQRFPWQVDIANKNEHITGSLIGYNWNTGGFSAKFEYNSSLFDYSNIKLDSNILLNSSDELRMRYLYTALTIYECLSKKINLNNASDFLCSVFAETAIIAYVVAAKPERSIVFEAEHSKSEKQVLFFKNVVKWVQNLFGGDSSSSNPPSAPLPPPPLSVSITNGSCPVNADIVHYLEKEESMDISLIFNNKPGVNAGVAIYEPEPNIYINYRNGAFFNFTHLDGSPLGELTSDYKIRVTRRSVDGYIGDGTTSIVFFFGQNTVINASSAGIMFHEPYTPEPVLNKSVFLVKFTVKKENVTCNNCIK